MFLSCDSKVDDSNDSQLSSSIVNRKMDKEYVLNRDAKSLLESDSEVSIYVDSILSGSISAEFISTGQKCFDINNNDTMDISFELIDLNEFNLNGLPKTFSHLAARVLPQTIEILDNSIKGYPDVVLLGKPISTQGNWSQDMGVLGTFSEVGNFQGEGDRFLGFRFAKEKDYLYEWIRIECSDYNDTLKIVDYAYNNLIGSSIDAGQVN